MKKLLGPSEVLVRLKRKHRRHKARGQPCDRRQQFGEPGRARPTDQVWASRCFLLPALRLIWSCSSVRRRRSSKRLSSQSVRRAAPSPGGTEASRSFERPSSSIEKSSLPRAMPCQHCAVAAIMRNRQLEGMWSSVLAGSRRTLCVKSGGRCSGRSSTCRPGAEGAVLLLGARLASISRGRTKGPQDCLPPREAVSGLPAPIAYSCSRPSEATTQGSRARDALNGHGQGAGVLIHGGARVMVSGVLQSHGTVLNPYEGICCTSRSRHGKARRWGSEVALGGQTRQGLQLEDCTAAMRARAKISLSRPGQAVRPRNRHSGRKRRTAATGSRKS